MYYLIGKAKGGWGDQCDLTPEEASLLLSAAAYDYQFTSQEKHYMGNSEPSSISLLG